MLTLLAPIAMAMGSPDPLRHHHDGEPRIGMFTPPFGLNIFVTQALFKAPLSSIYPGLVPFIIIVALVIITYIPELSLFLTRYVN